MPESKSSFQTFSKENHHAICDLLRERDHDLAAVISKYGYPPLWIRPNTFETLVHIILEQQVSLASALATLNKLREKTKIINPENILLLTDEELRTCYLSRQKIVYVKALAKSIVLKEISLKEMERLSDEEIRISLLRLKGIGHWTIDVYLMFVLRHCDVFPIGDLAAVHAMKAVKKLNKDTTREKLLHISENWKPYRTIATMILWHFYLSSRKPASATP
jgi:DNA-3-methyladenine glycosylase II